VSVAVWALEFAEDSLCLLSAWTLGELCTGWDISIPAAVQYVESFVAEVGASDADVLLLILSCV